MLDRRSVHRQKVLKAGKIAFNNLNSVYDCRIRDLTEIGARLNLEHSWQVPEHFTFIDTHRGIQRPARVVWRGTAEIGVCFDNLG